MSLAAQLQDPTLADATRATGPAKLFDGLPSHQQTVAVVLALAMLVVVLELVRKRKLREEYSLIWSGTAIVLLLLALQHRVLDGFRELIGAVEPTSALFFGALVFLMLVSLQFSVRLSKLSHRNRSLSQRLALLEEELRELHGEQPALTEQQALTPEADTAADDNTADDSAA